MGRKKEKKNSNDFIWTDEESELLLSVVNDSKVAKAAKGVDNVELYIPP